MLLYISVRVYFRFHIFKFSLLVCVYGMGWDGILGVGLGESFNTRKGTTSLFSFVLSSLVLLIGFEPNHYNWKKVNKFWMSCVTMLYFVYLVGCCTLCFYLGLDDVCLWNQTVHMVITVNVFFFPLCDGLHQVEEEDEHVGSHK